MTELHTASWRIAMVQMRRPTCVVAGCAFVIALVAPIDPSTLGGVINAYGDDGKPAPIVADKTIGPEATKGTGQEAAGGGAGFNESD